MEGFNALNINFTNLTGFDGLKVVKIAKNIENHCKENEIKIIDFLNEVSVDELKEIAKNICINVYYKVNNNASYKILDYINTIKHSESEEIYFILEKVINTRLREVKEETEGFITKN